MIYIFVLLLLLFLSFRYDICGKSRGRDLWYLVMLIIFILTAGLRWRLGIDTPNYIRRFYYWIPLLTNLTAEDLSFGNKPLWVLLNSLIRTLDGRFYVVQLIQATFVNVLLFRYFKKHTRYIFTCLIFYFIWKYLDFNMEVMKASISIVITLYANDYILEKKWIRAYILLLLSAKHNTSRLNFL